MKESFASLFLRLCLIFRKPLPAKHTEQRFRRREFAAGIAFFHALDPIIVKFTHKRKHTLVEHAVDDGGFDHGVGDTDVLHQHGKKMPVNLSANNLVKQGGLRRKIHEGKHFFEKCGVNGLIIRGFKQFPEASVAHIRKQRSEIGNINTLRSEALNGAVERTGLQKRSDIFQFVNIAMTGSEILAESGIFQKLLLSVGRRSRSDQLVNGKIEDLRDLDQNRNIGKAVPFFITGAFSKFISASI